MYLRQFTLVGLMLFSQGLQGGEHSIGERQEIKRFELPANWEKAIQENLPEHLSEEERLARAQAVNPDSHVGRAQQLMIIQLLSSLFKGEMNPEIVEGVIANSQLAGEGKPAVGLNAHLQLSMPKQFVVPLSEQSYKDENTVLPEFLLFGEGVRARVHARSESLETIGVPSTLHLGIDFVSGEGADAPTFMPVTSSG